MTTAMNSRWRIHPHDAAQIAALEKSAGVSPVVAQLLSARGVTDPAEVRTFLEAKLTGLREPQLLPGASAAAKRIFAAIEAERPIVVFGDYDADGMTGAAILYSCLQLLKANVKYYVPNRLEEGYGLSHDALELLHRRGASMVITVDCGIANIEEAETAQKLGLELIVTDHHQFASTLPAAAELVHPQLPGGDYPFHGLCGAGVALKVAWALCQLACGEEKVTKPMREFLLQAVGLAAFGTVADVVPLQDENRILVKHGLRRLKDQPVAGIQAMLNLAQLNDRPELRTEDIGFTLAPRLNAAGRLGHARLGIELLTTRDPERAQALAEYFEQLNEQRDTTQNRIERAARKVIREDLQEDSDPAFVIAGRDWHPGVIGIVAGRLQERFHRPVLIISQDKLGAKPATGSGRSGGRIDLHKALSACSDYLVGFGGHAAAAGFKVEEDRIDAFRAAFCEVVQSELGSDIGTQTLRIDAEAPLSQLTLRTIEQIELLAPFGAGNPRPMLCACGVELAEPPKMMGASERHFSVRLKQHGATLRGVAFNKGEDAHELEQFGGPFDIAFRPVINEWRGRKNVEMHLADWRPSSG